MCVMSWQLALAFVYSIVCGVAQCAGLLVVVLVVVVVYFTNSAANVQSMASYLGCRGLSKL